MHEASSVWNIALAASLAKNVRTSSICSSLSITVRLLGSIGLQLGLAVLLVDRHAVLVHLGSRLAHMRLLLAIKALAVLDHFGEQFGPLQFELGVRRRDLSAVLEFQ